MTFKQLAKIEEPAKQKRWYSDRELEAFEAKLAKYRTTIDGRTHMDWDKFYKDEGVMTDRGVVCNYIIKNKDGEITDAGIPMNELQNLISQWEAWDSKRNYGKKMQMFAWEKIASTAGETKVEHNAERAGQKKYAPTEEGKAEYLRLTGEEWKEPEQPLSNES